jgi:hypothetical protein
MIAMSILPKYAQALPSKDETASVDSDVRNSRAAVRTYLRHHRVSCHAADLGAQPGEQAQEPGRWQMAVAAAVVTRGQARTILKIDARPPAWSWLGSTPIHLCPGYELTFTSPAAPRMRLTALPDKLHCACIAHSSATMSDAQGHSTKAAVSPCGSPCTQRGDLNANLTRPSPTRESSLL